MILSSEEVSQAAGTTAARGRVGRAFSFRNRGLLAGLLLIPAAVATVFSQPLISESSWPALMLNVVGWLFFLLYVVVRTWSTLFVGGRKDHQLQTKGPYSLCRNPLYFGSLCFALSVVCFLKSITFGVALLSAAFFYVGWVIRAEEQALERLFQQEFRDYCRLTPRLWPRFSVFQTPETVAVDLKGLRREFIRLARAAVCPLALTVVMSLHEAPWWPHLFSIP